MRSSRIAFTPAPCALLATACTLWLAGCAESPASRFAADGGGSAASETAPPASPAAALPAQALLQTRAEQESAHLADAGLRAAFLRARQAEAGEAFHLQTEGTTLTARNADHHFVARYAGGRVQLEQAALEHEPAPWHVDLSLAGIGRAGQRTLPELRDVTSQAARVEYRRAGAVEWYANGPLGLEQGFTIEAPAAGEGQLEVAVQADGELELSGGGSSAELRDAEGQPVLRVSELYASDATGRQLPAEMEVQGDTLVLRVDDHDARYPIEIDPLVALLQSWVAGNGATSDSAFGWSADVENGTAVIGAPTDGSGVGAAYVFVRSGSTWSQQAKLFAASSGTTDPSAWFGYSVAISGNTIAVGAPHTRATTQGRVHVFTRSGSTWSQQAILTITDTNGDHNDLFGTAVALEGNTLFASALDGETAPPTSPDAGVANLVDYGLVYRFIRTNNVWGSAATLTQSGFPTDLGRSLALMGPTLLAGARDRVLVYNRNSTGNFVAAQTLTSPSGSTTSEFGAQVALAEVTSTSTGTALIGEPQLSTTRGTHSGAAQVYVRSGSTSFAAQAQLVPTSAATDTAYGSVTLASNGPSGKLTAVVAAAAKSSSIALFTRSGSTWTQQSVIPGSDPASNTFGFGWSVAMDADTLVAGFPFAPFISVGGLAGIYRVGAGNGDACSSAAQCASGFCVDGVCCNTACAGGTSDCQACSTAAGAAQNGVCGFRPRTIVCRAAASGGCDVAETCSGSSAACPSDAKRPSTFVCRAATDTCDATEYCSGSSNSCPADAIKPAGAVCRAAPTGPTCDVSETCSGTSKTCPADGYLTFGTTCRPAADLCDAPDFCTGTSATCADARLCP